MNGKFPLQPLLDLAQDRMNDAARKLGELIASERDSQQKLEMLQNYRNEYHTRFMQAAREGIGPDAWRNFSTFLGRIDEAITSQAKLLEQSRHQTAQGQQAWITQRNKVKAFDTLSQRHQAGVVRSENRREQKMTDEHAAKKRGQEEE
jgi:flagellar protein FliJ